ncbi:MAG: ATP-dependent DNA helicase RecG [Verrucomicrobia bacterium]|nr:ATP-dependent DNA helicase RecG [Verrucomicrobiota bacterium]
MPLAFDAPLSALPGLNAPRLKALRALGLESVGDALEHFPRRHEDRRSFPRFPTEESETAVCVCGVVEKAVLKRLPGRRSLVEITLRERAETALSGRLVIRFFNIPYLHRQFPVEQVVVVHGKPRRRGAVVGMDHPDYEFIEDDGEEAGVHTRRIVPIHPAGEGISPRVLRGVIYRALAAVDPATIPERLPGAVASFARGEALRQIHFPSDEAALAAAREQLKKEEFFGLQLAVALRRAETVSHPGAAHCGPGALLDRLLASLPFAPTGAQARAIAEIRRDLAAPQPMNRLLQGDVGSGKTLVALAAMLLCVESGHQAVLMAPTQILAEQHWLNFARLLAPLGLRVGLAVGGAEIRLSELAGDFALEAEGASAPAQIVVGTHALLYESGQSALARVGLAVIDEQHKFGVLQRTQLTARFAGSTRPDVLVMSATPIPRTLAITLYGDLDVSILDELPPGRGRIVTGVRSAAKRAEAAKFIGEQLAAGRQAYLVHALIDESEKLDAKAAAAQLAHWREALAPQAVGLLHGRLKPVEKQQVMEAFRRGELRALVSTTVIEVGVDVPNANLMLIENAERFGLAQLHQLRGRVGRGAHKSYCILLHDPGATEALPRLQVLENTTDGFKVAEADLALRGAGDILGTSQSGLPPLRLGDLLADAPLMLEMRRAAQEIVAADPRLERPEHAPLRVWAESLRRPVAGA